jgi:UPF0755 protein
MKEHITHIGSVCNAWCQEWRMYDRVLPAAFLSGVLVFLIYFISFAPPLTFPAASFVKIKKGQSITETAVQLQEGHIIRSQLLFKVLTRVYGQEARITSGEYFFAAPQPLYTVVHRMMRGDFELTPVRVTIPEGTSVAELTSILKKKIPDFDAEAFLAKAEKKEGYLFPDTYFFLPGVEPETVVAALEDNFNEKIQKQEVLTALAKFGRPLHDVLIMASLLEKEAADMENRRIVAGILWRRISLGMPLQVDAVFPYILGKNTFQVTREDLKVDSPYNTYKYKGLPAGPIANPGLGSILAAVTPVKTNYLFYLTDMDSQFHYSVTYTQHLSNKRKYLP